MERRTPTTLRAATAALAVALLSLTACSEKQEAGEFDGWKARNDAYLDSVAAVARANADGSWTMYKAFSLGDPSAMDGPSHYYVYVQKLERGEGTLRPQYNDSVRVHYSGRLIPSASYPQGFNFGKSFNGAELDAATDVPSLFGVSQTGTGFCTALMNMVEGDRWRVVVPYYLGYGSTPSTTTGIPAYSTLLFDVTLARIYRYQVDTDTSWW